MVHTRVLVTFILTVIVQIKANEVVLRGAGGDGTYSEVHQSQQAIPGGESKSFSTFSSRVLNSPGSTQFESRILGPQDFGFPSKPNPFSPPKMPSLFNSDMFPLSPFGRPGRLRFPKLPGLFRPQFPSLPFGGGLFDDDPEIAPH